MSRSNVSRGRFLQAVAGAGAAAATPLPVLAQAGAPVYRRLPDALVLSGGGARGAYQAGIINALVSAGGIRDGSPLDPFEFVCGTSIGALNGYMVATGQYSRLQALWNSIAAQNVLQIKPEFAAIEDHSSGLATRLSQTIALLSGLRKNVMGIFQSEPVLAILKANVDPAAPLLVPFAWTSTNLSTGATEYFYRMPHQLPQDRKDALTVAFRATIGPSAILREVPDDQLHTTLFASAAIPLVFDPVLMSWPDGSPHQYCDGGVAANTPIGLARTVAQNVHVILMDPPRETDMFDNAVEIGFGIYGVMQRRLLENDIRAAFLEGVASGEPAFSGTALTPDQLQALQNFLSPGRTQLSYIRPKSVLPVKVGAFADSEGIKQAMQLGFDAARSGFTPYTVADFFSTAD